MSLAKYLVSFACLSITSATALAQSVSNLDGVETHVVSTIHSNRRTFKIHFDARSLKIVFSTGKNIAVLAKIPRRFDPELVGAGNIIGFLPLPLQPYRNKDVLVYISSIRTSGGDGGGQCGAGVEIYMNFLDVSRARPKQISSILIGSCNEPIELAEINLSDRNLGDITVVNGKLSLRFLFYNRVEGKLVGIPSADYQSLIFNE